MFSFFKINLFFIPISQFVRDKYLSLALQMHLNEPSVLDSTNSICQPYLRFISRRTVNSNALASGHKLRPSSGFHQSTLVSAQINQHLLSIRLSILVCDVYVLDSSIILIHNIEHLRNISYAQENTAKYVREDFEYENPNSATFI